MATCEACLHKEVCFDHCERQHKEEGCSTCSIRVCAWALGMRACEHFVSVTRGRAHWIINGDWAECSNPKCREASKLAMMEHKDYCPACGAHMIGEVPT